MIIDSPTIPASPFNKAGIVVNSQLAIRVEGTSIVVIIVVVIDIVIVIVVIVVVVVIVIVIVIIISSCGRKRLRGGTLLFNRLKGNVIGRRRSIALSMARKGRRTRTMLRSINQTEMI